MTDEKIREGNIQLVNFGKLDESEIEKVRTLLLTRIKKLRSFNSLKLNLKIHKHSTQFIHEIEGELHADNSKRIGAVALHKNLYTALDEVMQKLINELEHSQKKYSKNVKKN